MLYTPHDTGGRGVLHNITYHLIKGESVFTHLNTTPDTGKVGVYSMNLINLFYISNESSELNI